MKPIRTISGRAVAIRRTRIDTDQIIAIRAAGFEAPIRMSADSRQRFLDGRDGIDVTLQHEAAIRLFERTHVPIVKAQTAATL